MGPTNDIGRSIATARTYLAEHPEEARYTDSPATAVVEDGLRCRVEGPHGFALSTDMPSGVGGTASGPSPGWVARAAQAACDATVVAMRAAELGIALRRLEVVVDGESDDRGLLGMDDSVPAGPLTSRIRVRISAEGVEPGALGELVHWADEHSPVSDAFRRAVPVSIELETAD
jgi:uncharacterized OsmC-like protein